MLNEQGLFYFTAEGELEHARALTEAYRNIPEDIALRFGGRDKILSEVEQNWARLEELKTNQNIESIVISSEHIANTPDQTFWNRLLSGISDFRIIGYLRDPFEMFVSDVNQKIRSGYVPSDIFVKGKNWRFWTEADRLLLLNQSYPERVQLRRFDKENLIKGDVIDDFQWCLSDYLNKRIVLERPLGANESLSAEGTAVLLGYNLNQGQLDKSSDEWLRRERVLNCLRIAESRTLTSKFSIENEKIKSIITSKTAELVAKVNEQTGIKFEQQPMLDLESLEFSTEAEELQNAITRVCETASFSKYYQEYLRVLESH